MPLWHEGRLLFVRERASGLYGTTSYFLSIVFFDILPMRILPPIVFGLISSFMMGLRTSELTWAFPCCPAACGNQILEDLVVTSCDGLAQSQYAFFGACDIDRICGAGVTSLLTFVLIVILVNVAASTSTMAIGAAIPSTSIANMVSCLYILYVTLLGGFFLSRKQMLSGGIYGFVSFLSRFSYIRYVDLLWFVFTYKSSLSSITCFRWTFGAVYIGSISYSLWRAFFCDKKHVQHFRTPVMFVGMHMKRFW